MTHRGPFQPLLFCDSVIHGSRSQAVARTGLMAGSHSDKKPVSAFALKLLLPGCCSPWCSLQGVCHFSGLVNHGRNAERGANVTSGGALGRAAVARQRGQRATETVNALLSGHLLSTPGSGKSPSSEMLQHTGFIFIILLIMCSMGEDCSCQALRGSAGAGGMPCVCKADDSGWVGWNGGEQWGSAGQGGESCLQLPHGLDGKVFGWFPQETSCAGVP